jgi:hypothetical protein
MASVREFLKAHYTAMVGHHEAYAGHHDFLADHHKAKASYHYEKAASQIQPDFQELHRSLAETHEIQQAHHARLAAHHQAAVSHYQQMLDQIPATATGESYDAEGARKAAGDRLVPDHVRGVIPPASEPFGFRAVPRAGAPQMPEHPNVPIELEHFIKVGDD